ncbi:MAG: HAMP domain-containing histidine kinase [Reichenbachiella sp.]
MTIQRIKKLINSIFVIGVFNTDPIYKRQRIAYFNTIIVSLPIVYALFVLYDFEGFLIPLSEWYFDQFSFFLFSFVCALCLYLNSIAKSDLGKIIFLTLWPVIQHIIPIVYQNTPTDYYFAFPIGLIFHSLMIQVIYSSKYNPWRFSFFMILNFILTINFLQILQMNDMDGGGELRELAGDEFYVLVVILYWLLFNLVIFYIMRVIESHMVEITSGRELVEQQKKDLEVTMDKLKASSKMVVQSEKMASLGVFTAGIAHELNNPMNFIASGTAILFDKIDRLKKSINSENQEWNKFLTEIEQVKEAISIGVDKSSKIIQSLKNYSRQDNEPHEINNLVRCIKDAIVLIPNKLLHQVKLKQDFPEKIELKCSPNKLTQVFVNLIQNAIDASPKNGRVHLKAFLENENAVFEISDSGEGIKLKDRKRIFDPFYTTKKVGQGTGLGLYIVHDIIEEHNGKIVFTTKVKEGTTFKITLPIH